MSNFRRLFGRFTTDHALLLIALWAAARGNAEAQALIAGIRLSQDLPRPPGPGQQPA